jgi:hypothetical protein
MRLVRRSRALIFALLALGACRHVKNDPAVCPEYRDLRCVAGARCSMDKSRGCKVCQCEEMDQDSPVGDPDDTSRPPGDD